MLSVQASLLGKDTTSEAADSSTTPGEEHAHIFAKKAFHVRQPRCRWCTLFVGEKGARHTWYYCKGCRVPLCKSGPCFANFHDDAKLYAAQRTSKEVKAGRQAWNKRKRAEK